MCTLIRIFVRHSISKAEIRLFSCYGAVKDVVFPLSLVHCISFVSMIRRLSQQHAVVQSKIFKEKIEWAIIANLKILLVKCKQTNYQFGSQVRYPKMVWSFYHFSSLNVQPVDFNLIFFYQNASEKVCSCVYSIDRQGRSWWQNILREAVHPRTYNALVMTVQHKFLIDP